MTSTILTGRHLKRRDMCELSTGEEEKPSWIAIMIIRAIEILHRRLSAYVICTKVTMKR